MPLSKKARRWTVGLVALAAALVLGLVVWVWVIPTVLVSQLRAAYGGPVAIDGYWLGLRSAGVRGLVLREAGEPDAPVWLMADSVDTDLSLVALLLGRRMPGSINVRGADLLLRLDRDGQLATALPVAGAANGDVSVPRIRVDGAAVTIQREGRSEDFHVEGVQGGFDPRPDALVLEASTNDPTWGAWTARGRIDPKLTAGEVVLQGRRVIAGASRLSRLVFVPEVTWEHVSPEGPVDVTVKAWFDTGGGSPTSALVTTVDFLETAVDLPSLGLTSRGTTGWVRIENGIVTLENIVGHALDGRISGSGTMNFAQDPPRFDIALELAEIEVAETPERWGLAELQLNGRLHGQADLRVVLDDEGVDLSGSSGQAVIEGAVLDGIPIKSLRLSMQGEGDTLRYDTGDNTSIRHVLPAVLIAFQTPSPDETGSRESPTRAESAPEPTSAAATPAPDATDSPAPKSADPPPEPAADAEPPVEEVERPAGGFGFRLPREISTEIELEDVDLAQVLARVEAMGIHLPFVLTGRLSLTAKATIPLGSLREVRAYAFHGEASLRGANVAGVDLGDVRARLDLSEGLLVLSDFRGVLVEMPEGGLLEHTGPTEPAPAEGPLPPGGFRGTLRAQLDPPGELVAQFEGNALPLAELAAPRLPRPTPLSGNLTFDVQAQGDLERAADPAAWKGQGRLSAERISYEGSTLDAIMARVDLAGGRLNLPELSARLNGRPLSVRAGLDLTAPHAFDARLDVAGWRLAEALALLPDVPQAAVDGALTAEIDLSGTLAPRVLKIQGQGRIAGFRAGPVPLGDVPFQLATEGEAIFLDVAEANPFGGTLRLKGRLPTIPGPPVQATATFAEIDLARLSTALPEGTDLSLTGRAEGQAELSLRTDAPADTPPLEVNLKLKAPNLTVQGLPASGLQAVVTLVQGALAYDLYAESLGGRVQLKGSIPLSLDAPAEPAGAVREPQARLQAVGFDLEALGRSQGAQGMLAGFGGLGALDANLRGPPTLDAVRVGGIVEFRDVTWRTIPLGDLRGIVARTPAAWRIDPLTGTLFGGALDGSARGTTTPGSPPEIEFAATIARVELARALRLVTPRFAGQVQGVGTLRASGRLTDALRVRGEIAVDRAQLAGLALTEGRIPLELTYIPSGPSGTIVVRNGRARLAGGQLQAGAELRLGFNRTYQGSLRLNGIDLEPLARVLTQSPRPASGRISGSATFAGNDLADLRRLQGRLDMSLDDAAVFELPVFREVGRFLGTAREGVFEEGTLRAGIANGQFLVEELALAGRVAQLHATGTVGFDTRLELIVLINTSQIIPESGQALIRLIPGLNAALGQRDLAFARVATFLSNRLIKLRVTGTLANPQVAVDPTVLVTDAAVGFFSGTLGLPLGLLR